MKKIKILTITLLVVLITMISFLGVYTHVQNRMENKVKDYAFAMDIDGARTVTFKLKEGAKTIVKDAEGNEVADSENLTDEQIQENGYVKEEKPYNYDEEKTIINYKKAKSILEKRFKDLNIENYIIRLNEETGEIAVEIPEDDMTDKIISNLVTKGNFAIKDAQTKEMLMNNDDIKTANVSAATTSVASGSGIYLTIEFTKDGANKFEKITENYKSSDVSEKTNETVDDSAEEVSDKEETVEKKQIVMEVDGDSIMTTDFDEVIRTGKLQLSIGNRTTETDTLSDYLYQASSMAIVLKNGELPLSYEIGQNEYVKSDITENELDVVIDFMLVIVIIAIIVLFVRYKMLAAAGVISYIGYISLLLLVIRYANVTLSMEGIFGIAISLILNYIFVNKFLGKIGNIKELTVEKVKKANKETYKEFFINIIPVIIMTVVFCFIKWTPISSFGMVMMWGIALMALYNVIITNSLLKIKAGIREERKSK